jgi:hypothetical protein
MPQQLMISRVPVDLSIVEFNLDAGEDIFLTYTWERSEGPALHRTGTSPPFMALIGGEPGLVVTHPFGFRVGMWLIRDAMRMDEMREVRLALVAAQSKRAPREQINILQQSLDELKSIRAHDAVFKDLYPDHEIIGMQGCGSLTLDVWKVAYINNSLSPNSPTLVCLPRARLESQTYSCLVKWKAPEFGTGRVTIEEVRFNRENNVREPNEMIWIRLGNQWYPRGDLIEFAISSPQVIRRGQVVPAVTTCHQFGDLRKLILMPNLNPDGPLYPGELPKQNGSYRPRLYFNAEQYGDIWLGEDTLLNDRTQNFLRLAMSGPIFLPIPPGSNKASLRGAMNMAGYRECSSTLGPLSSGEWRFIPRSVTEYRLEVYFKSSTSSWALIGTSSDNKRLFCLACAGKTSLTGYTLEQAAENLLQAGASNAVLVDEGSNVFQKVRWNGEELIDILPAWRRRMRALFIFARHS